MHRSSSLLSPQHIFPFFPVWDGGHKAQARPSPAPSPTWRTAPRPAPAAPSPPAPGWSSGGQPGGRSARCGRAAAWGRPGSPAPASPSPAALRTSREGSGRLPASYRGRGPRRGTSAPPARPRPARRWPPAAVPGAAPWPRRSREGRRPTRAGAVLPSGFKLPERNIPQFLGERGALGRLFAIPPVLEPVLERTKPASADARVSLCPGVSCCRLSLVPRPNHCDFNTRRRKLL